MNSDGSMDITLNVIILRRLVMKHKLIIIFNEQDLKMISESGQKVVIIRQTEHSAGNAVAWVCFNPSERNIIEWEDNDYSIYSSTSKIENITTIIKSHEEKAIPTIRYEYWDGPLTPPSKSSIYYASNFSNEFPQITLGLSQSIIVNGKTYSNYPINAFSVPFRQSIEMEPGNLISVLLRKNAVSSMLLPYDTNRIIVNYNQSPEYTILYEGDNRFKRIEG